MKNLGKSDYNGITLIALVITIIVLLILSGITIASIAGNNGIIQKVIQAKENSEIDSEKEMLEISVVQAMDSDKHGDIKKVGLEKTLIKNVGNDKTQLEEIEGESIILVTFKEAERVYEVDGRGKVNYLGKEKELMDSCEIMVNPTDNSNPKLVQTVEVTLKTQLIVKDENISLKYAWSLSDNNIPETLTEASLSSSGRKKVTSISSVDTEKGNYYLWIKANIEQKEIIECFGPYSIKDHTTLVVCSTEDKAESSFLGNETITRNTIEKVSFETSLDEHSLSDTNCWDVSQSQNGEILAWYEDNDNDGYYEVTIAQDGGVIANPNSTRLLSYIGYNGDDANVIEGIENLNTKLVTNMESMFYSCGATKLELNSFDTSSAISMRYMFDECRKLKNLDVSKFDTSKVTNMFYMFRNCIELTSLDVSGFDTSNVTDMAGMFCYCRKLEILDVSKFDTSNVTSMAFMFNECKELTNMDVSKFDTSRVINMLLMFTDCKKLTNIDVSKFDTSNVVTMSTMFAGCSGISTLDVSGFDTSKVTSMINMFSGCNLLKSLDVSGFDTSKVTEMGGMFNECKSLTSLDVSKFDTSNVKNMSNMFAGCSGISILDVSKFDTSNVTSMVKMFYNCSGLNNLDVSKFNTSKVTNMASMFAGCSGISTLNVRGFNTSNVIYMGESSTNTASWLDNNGMFYGCSGLTELDLSTWDTSKVISIRGLFNGCTNLNTLKLNKFITSQITDSIYYQEMFTNVPTTIQITTNATMKTWLETNFANWAINIIEV